MIFDTLYPCESTINHEYAFNVYLSKKSKNITEAVGNMTFKIPLDNTRSVSILYIIHI